MAYIPGLRFTGDASTAPGLLEYTWAKPEAFFSNVTSDDLLYQQMFNGYVLQEYTGSSWETIQTYDAEDVFTAVIAANHRIRLGTRLKLPGNPEKVAYDNWFDTDGQGISAIERAGQVEHADASVSFTKNSTIFRIDAMVYTDAVPQVEHSGGNLSTDIERHVYAVVPYTYEETGIQVESSALHTKFSVTRVTGGAIGG